jgi:hypothetical protein
VATPPLDSREAGLTRGAEILVRPAVEIHGNLAVAPIHTHERNKNIKYESNGESEGSNGFDEMTTYCDERKKDCGIDRPVRCVQLHHQACERGHSGAVLGFPGTRCGRI